MLKKPFILSLLLLIISIILVVVFNVISAFLKLKYNIFMMPIIYGTAAFYIGRIFANKYKIKLTQRDRIKTILYFSFVQLIFLLSFLIFMLDVKTLDSLKLFTSSIVIIIFLTIISILFMYFTLELGCLMEIKTLEKTLKNNKGRNLQ